MTRLAALRLAYSLATRVAGVAHWAATMIAVVMREERVAIENENRIAREKERYTWN
jgi:hypothetical protein